MLILGINCAYHDSSICLVRDGEVLWLLEEERFSRVKHAKTARLDTPQILPRQSMEWLLTHEQLEPGQIERIAIAFDPEARIKAVDLMESGPRGSWGSADGEQRFFDNMMLIPSALRDLGYTGEVCWVPHHLAHAGSTFFTSAYEVATVLVLDGIGETDGAATFDGEGNQLELLRSYRYPNSLGFLWEKLCKLLGFSEYDASKVMGLAAYGESSRFRVAFSEIASVNKRSTYSMRDDILQFRHENLDRLEAHFGIQRRKPSDPILAEHADIAASLQEVTNEICLGIALEAHSMARRDNLCLAGGVALNCVANRYILEHGPYENLSILPAANDAGTAAGAALVLWHEQLGNARVPRDIAPYLGPSFSAEKIEAALRAAGLHWERPKNIARIVARLLADGLIIGWFQGRMEFGPRALGNRSILADPRDPGVRDRINRLIKYREDFRPFAPSVLAEAAEDWFSMGKSTTASDHMLLAVPVRSDRIERIPAVVHQDGTARIQTVRRSTNPLFHDLIQCFGRVSGVPMVLNTSFNSREPIVCLPSEAIATFLGTNMDGLAIGDYLVVSQ